MIYHLGFPATQRGAFLAALYFLMLALARAMNP